MIHKQFAPSIDKVRIVFELPASLWADQISVVGDFNEWNPLATPLLQDRDGIWRASIDLPVGNRYGFRYLIDGRWSTDAHADGVTRTAHGSFNSIVTAEPPTHRPNASLRPGMIHEASPYSLDW